MIVAVVAALKNIVDQGKDYLWPKPSGCPRCKGRRLWGHGFVSAYFDECESSVYLRRYRCPECGCVIRLKPQGYFNRFQSCMEAIRTSLSHRLRTGTWLHSLSRSRQRHWLKALERKAKAYFGDVFDHDLLEAFDRLCEMGKTPVSRSI